MCAARRLLPYRACGELDGAAVVLGSAGELAAGDGDGGLGGSVALPFGSGWGRIGFGV